MGDLQRQGEIFMRLRLTVQLAHWLRLMPEADDSVCSNEIILHFVSAPVSPANRRGCVQREGEGSRKGHNQADGRTLENEICYGLGISNHSGIELPARSRFHSEKQSNLTGVRCCCRITDRVLRLINKEVLAREFHGRKQRSVETTSSEGEEEWIFRYGR
ncbi:hypothetical protein K0M31_003503 [Melipona bicolor]|uniref:Uncharacterized protein n=1 Tax=Melipona bicolor TaxID=60889 RepID=A0AA40FZM7_9HYME|nr:hypothetical protein K0M31_003503 [Melipona bicolor]